MPLSPGSKMSFGKAQNQHAESESEESSSEEEQLPKSAKNKLTGKYDMSVLREVARVEEAAIEELVELYGCEEEDELECEFDIHELMDMDPSERRSFLADKLAGCPKPTDEFMDKYLDKIATLNPKIK